MSFESASDRAFRLFIKAYGKAWAPKRGQELEPKNRPDPPSAEDEKADLVATIIAKSKAWGDTPF